MSGAISTVVSPCGRYSLTWHEAGSTMVVPLFRDMWGVIEDIVTRMSMP
jgi:hypothetical protein